MKKHFIGLMLFSVLIFSNQKTQAQSSDTIVVPTFSFGSPQEAWFLFPSDTIRFEKILMEYTLKCNPNNNPPCGEWDYLTHTYVYDHTGYLDSSAVVQPMFLVNNAAIDTISYMNSPTYKYLPHWQYFITHTNTVSLNTGTIGTQSISINHPFGSDKSTSKSQYLWRSSELTSAGIIAGNITGIKFNILSVGSSMRNLSIRMKSTTMDSLSIDSISNTGFINVYSKNTQFSTLGWNDIQFTSPMNWDGSSNIIIEISFDNLATGTANPIAASVESFTSALINSGNDRMINTAPNGFINIPINNEIATIDTAVTISLWIYGNSLQPMDGTCFEAVDSSGNRLLNTSIPWSDSKVYWDAGYSGINYDRISKTATTAEIKEQWNNWTFTKSTNSGIMNIYLNGTLWHSETGKSKSMSGIGTFLIGKGTWNGSKSYEGFMDDFAVFNTVLDTVAIKTIFNQGILSLPNYASNLVTYYTFDDGNNYTVTDLAPNGTHSQAVLAATSNSLKPSDLLFKNNFIAGNTRPNVIFEQGIYTSHIDSALVIDSIMNTPIIIVEFADSVMYPGSATDSLFVWPTAFTNFTYNNLGQAVDSVFVPADATKILHYYTWYRIFPKVNRYELARYITPYGNNLTLGDGWKWTFDVSDYRTLLADSVHLTAGNWQELLDMKFIMIKGIPPRDVVDIKNLYTGSFNYGLAHDPIENHLPEVKAIIPATAVNARWKSRITGHGMDSPENCSEFCAKYHYFKVNNILQFTKLVWRDNCDLNPLYPQGGTWVYDRANWCPGAEVWTYDMEIPLTIAAGDTLRLDHDVQPYTSNGPWNYFQIEDQLVSYKAPNFTLDAALENIISPSSNQMFLRENPICTKPKVIIKNTGSTTLISLKISYGLEGATPSVYTWFGSLKFMGSEIVELDTFAWTQGVQFFKVSISEPNGGVDQYSNNNQLRSAYTYPPLMPSQFVIEVKTNNTPFENQYSLKDAVGNIILSRNELTANTIYRDTVLLTDGCYEFLLTDSGEDGLSFWANTAQGSGLVRFRRANTPAIIRNFKSDFGGQIYQQFTVGISSDIKDYSYTNQTILNVYPNPTAGNVSINFDFPERRDGEIILLNSLGQEVYQKAFKGIIADSIEADITNRPSGVYVVVLKCEKEVMVKKFVKR